MMTPPVTLPKTHVAPPPAMAWLANGPQRHWDAHEWVSGKMAEGGSWLYQRISDGAELVTQKSDALAGPKLPPLLRPIGLAGARFFAGVSHFFKHATSLEPLMKRAISTAFFVNETTALGSGLQMAKSAPLGSLLALGAATVGLRAAYVIGLMKHSGEAIHKTVKPVALDKLPNLANAMSNK
jgi:hypothetical protein